MTTTFHFEMNEPQYEYFFEGADVQLRCQGLVAAAAGPAAAFEEHGPRSWFELSPISGKRILAGVGRSVPRTTTSALETREAIWANAMAGFAPVELAETSSVGADCVYAMVDPTNGRVELGRAGSGASALIVDGTGTRLLQPVTSASGVGHATSFELSAGSTLVLLTHDPAEREALTSDIQRALGARSVRGDEVDAVLQCCIELKNWPVRKHESVVVVHLEHLSGSPVILSPSDPSPLSGKVAYDHDLVRDGTCNLDACRHRAKYHPKRCRSTSVTNAVRAMPASFLVPWTSSTCIAFVRCRLFRRRHAAARSMVLPAACDPTWPLLGIQGFRRSDTDCQSGLPRR